MYKSIALVLLEHSLCYDYGRRGLLLVPSASSFIVMHSVKPCETAK